MKARIEAANLWDPWDQFMDRAHCRERLWIVQRSKLGNRRETFLVPGRENRRLGEEHPAVNDPMANGIEWTSFFGETPNKARHIISRTECRGAGRMRHEVFDQTQLYRAGASIDDEHLHGCAPLITLASETLGAPCRKPVTWSVCQYLL